MRDGDTVLIDVGAQGLSIERQAPATADRRAEAAPAVRLTAVCHITAYPVGRSTVIVAAMALFFAGAWPATFTSRCAGRVLEALRPAMARLRRSDRA